jgi:hypothetical protein
MRKIITFSVITFFLLSLSGNVFAGTNTTDDEWHFMVAPLFLWGLNVDGTTQLGPATTPLNLDFKDDVIENLAAVFTLHFEAQKGDWTIFAEYQYAELDPSINTPRGLTADINFTDQLGEIGVAYKVATLGINDIQVLGGARYTRQDIDVKLNNRLQLVDVSENWWDGFIGLRVFTHISDNWTFIGRGDIGTGGSDLIWNIAAMFDYRFKDWGSAFLGYKWMDYDYESGSGLDRYAYDALEQGPLAGLAFYW